MALLHSRDGEGVSSLSFERGYCVMDRRLRIELATLYNSYDLPLLVPS